MQPENRHEPEPGPDPLNAGSGDLFPELCIWWVDAIDSTALDARRGKESGK
jgi:hypothetical protein